MTEMFVILVSTVLVNNLVLTKFLGLCPFFGVTRKLETAMSLSMATTFVLTVASGLSYLSYTYLLLPLELGYLKIIVFILIIAIVVQFTEVSIRRSNPLLFQILGIYLPLVASNCVILGVTLLLVEQDTSLFKALIYGFGTAIGFSLVLAVFAAIRERIQIADVPSPFRGAAISLLTAGIMSMAFMGFAGLVSS